MEPESHSGSIQTDVEKLGDAAIDISSTNKYDGRQNCVSSASGYHHSTSHNPVERSDGKSENENRGQSVLLPGKRFIFFLLGIWMLFTGWWIAGLVLHRHDKNWIIPFLLWLFITLIVFSLLLPVSFVWIPISWIWYQVIRPFVSYLPEKSRVPVSGALVVVIIVTVTFAGAESGQNTRANRAVSLLGLSVLIFTLWATSRNRKKVRWQRVIVGMLMQFIIALFVLRTAAGFDIFSFISTLARDLLGFAGDGITFLTDASVAKLDWFFIGVVPPIIFFVALVQMLYHYGVLQWFLRTFAVFFLWTMGVSGAEAVAAAASPFVGQGENAVLISPFVPHLTNAEIHQVMCSGFGTIAGSVLGAYIGLGVNPHALVSSCIMSIPASLVLSHLRYPEEEETLSASRVVIPPNQSGPTANGLHAFAKGAWLGIKVAGMIITVLLCVVALLALVNGVLTWWGSYINLHGQYDLTVELMLGYCCYPIAFLLGVPRNHELLLVGRLIGIKIVANEFVAYKALVSQPEYVAMSQRSQLISSYALCGFGNIAAVGTQIGVLSQIAPNRSGDISRLAFSALLTGILSTLSSASVAGMLMMDETNYVSKAVG